MEYIDRGLVGIEKIESLNEKIEKDSVNKNVCVFGQGFVGLPLALSFAIRGCNTIGVDVDDLLVANTNKGLTHHTEMFYDVTIQEILKLQLKNKRYKATTDAAKAVKNSNNIIVTVGVPTKDGKYIMDYLESACMVIGEHIKKEDLVVIRSTVVPGTTEEFVLPILEKESGMKAGVDFYLAYASERIAEGLAFDEFANMPTLVGAINEKSLARAAEVLSIVCKADIVPASCIKAVETSKVFENVQRDVNIAMSQEFARFTEALGIDIFEVVKLANTHKRVNLLTPGPGVGGYCIPNAYHYIAPKANELAVDMDILKLARNKNAELPQFIVNKAKDLLKSVGKELAGSNIAALGLAMKDYSNDDRISPPIDICNMLIEQGADVKAFDPAVPTSYSFKVNSQEDALKDADLIIILAKQLDMILDNTKYFSKYAAKDVIILDTKNVINREDAESHGLKLWRI
jgi:UDP-N-acetyl-D-mannosaminuronic acid dehydrogenase